MGVWNNIWPGRRRNLSSSDIPSRAKEEVCANDAHGARKALLCAALMELHDDPTGAYAAADFIYDRIVNENPAVSPKDIIKHAQSLTTLYLSGDVPAKEDVSFYGPVSRPFVNAVMDGWRSIPPAHKFVLSCNEFQLNAGRIGTDIFPDYVDVPVLAPDETINDRRTHINHTQGIYMSAEKTGVVTEFELASSYDQMVEVDGPTTSGILSRKWTRREDVAETVRHEAMHGFDHAFAHLSGFRYSDLPEFEDAHKADIAIMGGVEAARQAGYGYFVRTKELEEAGRREAFAEIGAELLGGSTSGPCMGAHGAFPHCAQAVASLNSKLLIAQKMGLGTLMHFVQEKRSQYIDRHLPAMKYSKEGVAEAGKVDKYVAGKWLDILLQDPKYSGKDFKEWIDAARPSDVQALIKRANENVDAGQENRKAFLDYVGNKRPEGGVPSHRPLAVTGPSNRAAAGPV